MNGFIKLLALIGGVLIVTPVLSRSYMVGKLTEAPSFNGFVSLRYIFGDYIVFGIGSAALAISLVLAIRFLGK